jgi:hypothetical protein
MSGIGPELPPHLQAKRKQGPELPPHLQRKRERSEEEEGPKPASRSASPESAQKRRRVAGPAMPPAPLDERPQKSPEDENDDSSTDDDYGPALPPGPEEQVSFPSIIS